MRRRLSGLLCAGLLCLAAGPAPAQPISATARLEQFTAGLDSLRARFVQSLFDAAGQVVQESSGSMVLQRPGRFRWDYEQPYEQHIVADGSRLWIYDTDLQQVTVKALDNALGNAPINLLSQRRPLTEDFELREQPSHDGLQWVELEPRIKDTDFSSITLGIDVEGLKVMELRDSFGQRTEIRFLDIELNVATRPELFAFEPPPGVDVVGKP